MLAGRDRQQGFFDAAWCSGLLAKDSIYALLAEHGDRIVCDADFADCYSARWGRPSIAPSLLAKVRFDLRWKVALDLPIDHPGFLAVQQQPRAELDQTRRVNDVVGLSQRAQRLHRAPVRDQHAELGGQLQRALEHD